MVAEHNTTTLQELKSRMEMLISYYRAFGEEQHGFVEELESRLRSVSDALRGDAGRWAC